MFFRLPLVLFFASLLYLNPFFLVCVPTVLFATFLEFRVMFFCLSRLSFLGVQKTKGEVHGHERYLRRQPDALVQCIKCSSLQSLVCFGLCLFIFLQIRHDTRGVSKHKVSMIPTY